jgi:hypothetical protein
LRGGSGPGRPGAGRFSEKITSGDGLFTGKPDIKFICPTKHPEVFDVLRNIRKIAGTC